jgi:hypothetical protein
MGHRPRCPLISSHMEVYSIRRATSGGDTDGRVGGQMDGRADRRTGGRTDGRAGRRTDGRMDRQSDGQTESTSICDEMPKNQNWKQIRKQKHFRKRLLSAGSRSAGSGSARTQGGSGNGSAKNFSGSTSLDLNEEHRHMARVGHALPKVSLGPTVPYPSTPCGRATPETTLRSVAVFYPLGHSCRTPKMRSASEICFACKILKYAFAFCHFQANLLSHDFK